MSDSVIDSYLSPTTGSASTGAGGKTKRSHARQSSGGSSTRMSHGSMSVDFDPSSEYNLSFNPMDFADDNDNDRRASLASLNSVRCLSSLLLLLQGEWGRGHVMYVMMVPCLRVAFVVVGVMHTTVAAVAMETSPMSRDLMQGRRSGSPSKHHRRGHRMPVVRLTMTTATTTTMLSRRCA